MAKFAWYLFLSMALILTWIAGFWYGTRTTISETENAVAQPLSAHIEASASPQLMTKSEGHEYTLKPSGTAQM